MSGFVNADSQGTLLSAFHCWSCDAEWQQPLTTEMAVEFRKYDDGYVSTLNDVSVCASRVLWAGSDLTAELTITVRGQIFGPVMFMPLRPASRRDVIGMVPNDDRENVSQVLTDLSRRVVDGERRSVADVVALCDVPRPDADHARLTVDPLPPLYRDHMTIWFGDGGTAKSLSALLAAGMLGEQGLAVLYLDWELDAADHVVRLEQLFGSELPETLLYMRCDKPLPQMNDAIRRTIRKHSIDFVVVDSVGYACGGAPESAEVATAYQQCVRRWGVGSLHLAHTTKGAEESAARRPFGSTFWHNGCREAWALTAGKTKRLNRDSAGETELTWTHRKNNFGTLEQNPRKYRLVGDSTTLALKPQLAFKPPTDVQRLCDVLRVRPMTRPELCERLGMEQDKLRPVLARAKKNKRINEANGFVTLRQQ